MKLSTLQYSFLLNLLLIGCGYILFQLAQKARHDYQRILEVNEELSRKHARQSRLNENIGDQNRVLELSVKELEKIIPTLHQEIETLRIKPPRTETLAQSTFEVNANFQSALVDSVIFDTVIVKSFHYKDHYLSVNGFSLSDTQYMRVNYQDTLTQVVYRGRRKRPWLWIFSPRILEQRASLKNPHSTITYSRVIHIQKP